MDKRHLTLAALTRWARAVACIPSQAIFVPEKPQIGSPFAEQLQWGTHGRERWPKLALAASVPLLTERDLSLTAESRRAGGAHQYV